MATKEQPKAVKQSIKDVLNKVYMRQKPKTEDFNRFCEKLEILRKNISQGIDSNESEEHIKNHIINFLNDSFYKETNLVNTKDRIDCAIYETHDSSSPIQVLIEVKRPSNDNEFPTLKNLNSKAMQETLLYFLREREQGNVGLKHIVITNGYEWYVFDAADYEKYFASNKELIGRYKEFDVNQTLVSEKTSFFYNKIATSAIDKVKNDFPYVYFNINNLSTEQQIQVFKLLSPEHLLKKFVCNDSNELNVSFYNELLYILGLEEYEEGNKKIIRRLEKNRQNASFIENAINMIEDEEPNKNKHFDIALSLTITWINRILFLKLLETQLVNYHKGDHEYCFLNNEKIKGFDDLHQLFFKVLAVPMNDRKPDVAEKYRNVPYLNSSLFEMAENETSYKISGLRDENLPIYKQTVLYNSRNSKRLDGELPILEYLFRFLDAYDFGSEPNDESLTRDTHKTLINASVLGLIFEKINGYKDGSFFTPGAITQYMCKNALRNAVVQKFNQVKGWQCKNFDELMDKYLDSGEANLIINSLHICDPAVGSGHFLVSALNELIVIKAELHVLLQSNGKRLKYPISIENDELMIVDEDGNPFLYNPKNPESQLIQESLFNEKRTIIENCLFGVDINPNSVNICRLRLWIELLKNAYYKSNGEFETLPNIDINIKCGNSLISRFDFSIDVSKVLKKKEVATYKTKVKAYKETHNKTVKHELKETIEKLKNTFRESVKKTALYQYSYNKGLLWELNNKIELFEQTDEEKKNIEKQKNILKRKISEYEEKQKNKVYENSMEWRFEFPETLDNEGNFMGFDVIIGNPPYGVSIKGDLRDVVTIKLGKVPDYEIYYFFIHLSQLLLKDDAILSFIIPNTWLFNVYAKDWRAKLFNQWDLLQVLDCTRFKIFDEANVRNTIVTLLKTEKGSHIVRYKNTKNSFSFNSLVIQEEESLSETEIIPLNINWGLAFSLSAEIVEIVNKITNVGKKLQFYFPEISQGLIAYDKYKGQNKEVIKSRAYHHSIYKNGYKKWLWGEDVRRYVTVWNGKEYIDYCSGIANPRQPKFFKNKRLLIREITNPSIYANIATEEMYNDPAIIIVLDSDNYPLEVALSILNSKLGTFYHFNHSPKATKGEFPKILVQDIKDFPLPFIEVNKQKAIIALVDKILASKKQDPTADTSDWEREIDLYVYYLYGLTLEEAQMIDRTVTAKEFEKLQLNISQSKTEKSLKKSEFTCNTKKSRM